MFKTIDKLHFCDLLSPEFDMTKFIKKIKEAAQEDKIVICFSSNNDRLYKLIDDTKNDLSTHEQFYVFFWCAPEGSQKALIDHLVANFRNYR